MNTHNAPSTEKMTFERAYTALGMILTQLESGEASLDETLALYEEGRKLVTLCEQFLDTADLRITQISDAENESR